METVDLVLTTDGIFHSDDTTEDALEIRSLASSYVMHKIGKIHF